MQNNSWKVQLSIGESFIYKGYKYQKKELIGNGTEAAVYKAEKFLDSKSQGDVALRIQKRYFQENYELWKGLQQKKWENTTYPIEVIPANHLVVEFELFDENLTHLEECLRKKYIVKIAKSISKAIYCMHDSGYLHLDVKPDNIVYKQINDDYKFALCDFSSMQKIEIAKNNEFLVLMTPAYAAPEIDLQTMTKGVDEKADVWAFGMTIYKLLTNLLIFNEYQIENNRKDQDVINSRLNEFIKNTEIKTIIQQCLEVDKNKRTTMQNLIAELEKIDNLEPADLVDEQKLQELSIYETQVRNYQLINQSELKQANHNLNLLPYRDLEDYIENSVGLKLPPPPSIDYFLKL